MAKKIVVTNMRATDPVANWDAYIASQEALASLCQNCQIGDQETYVPCYYCRDGVPVCKGCKADAKSSGDLLFCEDCS